MLNLQNTIYWKIQNTVSHEVKQSQERHQGLKCNTSLQTLQLTQPCLQYARKIQQLRNDTSSSNEIPKGRVKKREKIWIRKLKTLAPYGLNQELNQIHNVWVFCTA